MIRNKKENSRIKEMEVNQKIILNSQNFLIKNKISDANKRVIIEKCSQFFEWRIRFLKSGDWKVGLRLLTYLGFYPRIRSYLADVRFIITKGSKKNCCEA